MQRLNSSGLLASMFWWTTAPASCRPVAELTATDWDRVLGRPHESPPVAPSQPFMIESATPRPGIEPGNPINGHEYDTARPYEPRASPTCSLRASSR